MNTNSGATPLEHARGSSIAVEDIEAETAVRAYLHEEAGKLTRRDVPARGWRIADDQRAAFQRIVTSRDLVTLFEVVQALGRATCCSACHRH